MALEDDLGILLFERNTRGVRLTDADKQFVELVTAGIDHLDHAVKTVGMVTSGDAGREVVRVGAEMAAGKGLPVRASTVGETASGKFAIVEQSLEFPLVPWRLVIDRQLGREMAGVVQRGSVSWQLGRQRGLSR